MTIVGIIISIRYTYKNDGNDFEFYIMNGILGTVIGCCVGILFAVIIFAVTPHDISKERHDLVAIKDGSGINGSFFLGCGTIEDRNYYYYYEKSNDNGYKQQKILVDKVVLYEDATDSTAYIEFQHKISKTPYKKWSVNCGCIQTKIHVPKGTIIKQFKLDLE